MKKIRIDHLLVAREQAADLREAAAFVMSGIVFSGQQRMEKPGELVAEDIPLSVKSKEHPYVSRGGLKLAKALEHWKLELKGLRCADLGSSTGGFTDCMLKAGAAEVFAIDAGTNQLDWKLRKDPRVHPMENTNARTLDATQMGGPVQFASLDLSFISLEKILPTLPNLLVPKAFWVALVKPQFEAAKNEVPVGGVITDRAVQDAACRRVWDCAQGLGLGPRELIESPIHGRDGNLEFLLLGLKE